MKKFRQNYNPIAEVHQEEIIRLNPTESNDGIFCNICYNKYFKDDLFGLDCDHLFCKICMRDYIEYNITNGQILKIRCPDSTCKREFEEQDIQKFGSRKVYDKYLRFKSNIDVNLNPNLKWCPRPNCPNYVSKGKTRKVVC